MTRAARATCARHEEGEFRHASFEDAQAAMTSVSPRRFLPRPDATPVYDELYGLYRELHDAFGGVGQGPAGGLGTLMKRLLALRDRVATH